MSIPEPDNSHATRRKFLQASSVAVAGFSLAKSAHAAGSDKVLKVAWVGCGNRGTGAMMQALQTAGPVKLWAMADAFEPNLTRSLENLKRGLSASYDRDEAPPMADRIDVPKERQFVGLGAFQQAIDSGVDVVILTGPPGFRPQQFEYAITAGKHVFMEKPVATDANGVRRVIDAASEAKNKNLKVSVGLQRHHQPSYIEAMDRIHQGELGETIAMKCYWNTSAPAKQPFARENMTELEYQVRNWYFFSWLSGDHICEQHIHNLDVCNWAMQAYPHEAKGMGGRQVRTGKEYGDIFDHHAVEYTYPNGVQAFSQCRQIPGCTNNVAEFVLGTKARAEMNANVCQIVSGDRVLWRSERTRRGESEKSVSPYQLEQDALFQAIRNDLPYNEAENGARSTMTALLGRLATYSGKVVNWDEAIASEIALTTDALNWNDAAPIQPGKDGFYRIAVPGVTKVL